jgi:DNA-binding beta-propeller fold protein YncE
VLVSTGLKSPGGVAVDGQGNVYIADSGDSAIKKYTPFTFR